MARTAFSGLELAPTWPPLKEGDPSLCRHVKFSPRLMTFLERGRRTNRRMLDQLIIAYAAMGFGPEEAFEEA
jgi:hypothetical protein